MSIKNPRKTKQLRRELRQNMTEAEEMLWERVRNKKLCGVRVKRQYGFGPYVVDFFVPKANLVIEVDGKIHLSKEQKVRDKNKDTFLRKNSIEVIRIKNEEIFEDIDAAIAKLEFIIGKRIKPSTRT
ncbi:endonuclease domain-containing protein [Gracilimonas tropica]|uniref:endonuclease domain-containing protein n=1 Tax=Gracilimonas tropica TaxID=454600 RepID=UPI0012F847F9|nr:endonuclease domain-containing protein [Gracilimonas tropica]